MHIYKAAIDTWATEPEWEIHSNGQIKYEEITSNEETSFSCRSLSLHKTSN